jgi:hypothetical protein
MNTLDPAVRDLLVTIYGALDAAEAKGYPVCAAQTAIRSLVLYGNPELLADWMLSDPQLAEAGDAHRVRSADRLDLYDASKELPA